MDIEINKIYFGKHQEILKDFPDNYFDSCVTDPPYGISFMNQHWDYDVPSVEDWNVILRVMKPGAYLLCACGTRTQHRMVVNIEDAGFEIRDVITWHYGSGFPKSLDISKAIDKSKGVERAVVGTKNVMNMRGGAFMEAKAHEDIDVTEATSDEAKQWEGYGTALKPATEFWTLARKPLSENTVAANVLKWGTGGININGCRIDYNGETPNLGGRANAKMGGEGYGFDVNGRPEEANNKGRFPANVIFDEFTGKILDDQTGILTSGNVSPEGFKGDYTANVYGKYANNQIDPETVYGDSGGASRFFYCPKADNYERNKGLEKFISTKVNDGRETEIDNAFQRGETFRKNTHPTVKPIDLMRYLVKLITPKKGICLDPYCGSGTTLIGCKLELINFIGIDKVENHCRIAEARVAAWNPDKYIPQTLF